MSPAERTGAPWSSAEKRSTRPPSGPMSVMIALCAESVVVLRRTRHLEVRRFGAKPDKKICRRSGGEPEFMEDAPHGRLDGFVVEIDRFWVVCAARAAEWLSSSEQGFD